MHPCRSCTLASATDHCGALTTSKAVASSTTLGGAGRSLASVGLDVIARRFGSISGRNVLLQGTGAYAGAGVHSDVASASPCQFGHNDAGVGPGALQQDVAAAYRSVSYTHLRAHETD